MERIPEVMDCWFESGSMPFAQDHFPFENEKWQENNFPAGFVAEYIAQTRTWFYYSHVVSTILFDHAPYKNVVTTGTVRAEDGQKMSKSKNNFPDPNLLFDKYGVDALRIYLMSSPLMKGEDANFSEKLVQEIASKFVGRLFNVVSFYDLYRHTELESDNFPESKNVLDQWILSRLNQVIEEMTKWMDAYEMALAIAPLDKFIDDLSTWYLRRSRDRIKDGDKDAKQTMYFVLKNLVKIMAPFAPFCAENEWLKLRKDTDPESVHLSEWPKAGHINEEVLSGMMFVRAFASNALMQRTQAGIRVRQVLQSFTIKHNGPEIPFWKDLTEILKEEINVREIILDSTPKQEDGPGMFLDLNITPELKQEGEFRELVRGIQDIRKVMGLVPSDIVSLSLDTDKRGQDLALQFEKELTKVVGAKNILFVENDGTEVKVDELKFKIKLYK
jgi:isoleucyl-tRNA synthetase